MWLQAREFSFCGFLAAVATNERFQCLRATFREIRNRIERLLKDSVSCENEQRSWSDSSTNWKEESADEEKLRKNNFRCSLECLAGDVSWWFLHTNFPTQSVSRVLAAAPTSDFIIKLCHGCGSRRHICANVSIHQLGSAHGKPSAGNANPPLNSYTDSHLEPRWIIYEKFFLTSAAADAEMLKLTRPMIIFSEV